MSRDASDWLRILEECHVKPATAARWAPVFAAVIGDDTFSAGDADLAVFLGQVLHESAHLEHLEENLSYSAERLCAVWPRRFPTLASAQPFARNPQALAEKVYGGRLGNTEPGDGARYKGRGLLQVTGADNYALVQNLCGLDLLAEPDLLTQPEPALRASIAWWEAKIADAILDDPDRVTLAVNGGTNGLAERERLTELARGALA